MRIRLLSDSCAKGWASWGHGELWLTEDALVRIGKRAPASHVAKALSAGPAGREEMDVKWDSWAHYLATHHDVQVLAFEQIVVARLQAGLATSSLAVRLRHGPRIRLLWRRTPGTLQAIRAVLPA
ncbi:MAG TPA: hypothetical protein VGD29_27450 [Actinoplanes sp.]|jgi:hypothetical protein